MANGGIQVGKMSRVWIQYVVICLTIAVLCSHTVHKLVKGRSKATECQCKAIVVQRNMGSLELTLCVHSVHPEGTPTPSPSAGNTTALESTPPPATVSVTTAASTPAVTSGDAVTSGAANQTNSSTVSSGTPEELSEATSHLASPTESTDVPATSTSWSASAGSESTVTEHVSRPSAANLTNATTSDAATHSRETPAITESHLTHTLSSSSAAGSSAPTIVPHHSTTQLLGTNTSTAAPTTEDASIKESPSSGPVTGQTSQVTLATKAVAEATSTDSTIFSTGVTMEEVQHALSSGSIAAITVTVIVVVLLVFGVAAYLKIRHSSYGRLLDDHDYGSWGNYNNPLYDDS